MRNVLRLLDHLAGKRKHLGGREARQIDVGAWRLPPLVDAEIAILKVFE